MPLPGGRHEDPFEMRVPVESHPKHVPGFALIPIGGGKNSGQSGSGRRLVQRDFESNIGVALERKEMTNEREIRAFRIQLLDGFTPDVSLVNRGEVIEHAIRRLNVFFEKTNGLLKSLLFDPESGDLITGLLRSDPSLRESFPELGKNVGFS